MSGVIPVIKPLLSNYLTSVYFKMGFCPFILYSRRPVLNVFCSSGRATSSFSGLKTLFKIKPWVRCRTGNIKPKETTCIRMPTVVKIMSFSGTIFGTVCLHSSKLIVKCDSSLARPSTLDYLNNNHDSDISKQFDWKKFWKFLKPEILLLIGAIASALIVAVINIQIPALLGDVVNVVSKLAAAPTTDYIQEMKAPTLRLIYLYCVQGAFTFVYISLLSCIGERLACRLRQHLFDSIIKQDIAFFDVHKTGELVNRLTTDVQDFKSSFKLCISQGLRSLAQTAGCICSLYLISPKMTGVMLITLPLIVAVGAIVGSGLRKLSRIAAAQVAKATSIADEAIGNVRTVRAFAMENKEIELYSNEVLHAAHLSELLGVGIGAFQGIANVALNGIVLGVMYMGGYMMSTNTLSSGDLISFLVATQTIQRSLAQLSLLFGQYVKGMAAGARVFEVCADLRLPSHMYTNITPSIPLEIGNQIPYHTLCGDLEFRNVSFRYPTRPEQEVLKNFNLTIPAGKVVAICGSSGGGKSTLAALLERFYDVNSGKISLDGINIQSLNPSWLRGRVIGFINQEPVLFATSVMENIRYGRPNASDQEVIEAARLANAHEFICKFPNGYRTILGERGVTVSGGQKQRIAIARALLKNPSILILDEATSALDAESEKLVQEALDRVVKGRTVLVIAHRLSTIQNADMIAVLSGGVIAELGTHESLKKLKGLYWDLIRQQQRDEVLKGQHLGA